MTASEQLKDRIKTLFHDEDAYSRCFRRWRTGALIVMTLVCFLSGIAGTGSRALADESAKPLHLVLFSSGQTSGFWPMVEAFATAAAEDLGIQLDIRQFDDPVSMMEMVHASLGDPNGRPDGIIFHNYKHMGRSVLEAAEKAGVPALMFNAGPTGQDDFGAPRERFKHFIGLLTPDDRKAGRDLAVSLLKVAEERGLRGRDGKFHIVALEGNRTSGPAIERRKGLEEVVAERGDVVIDQFFHSKWRREKAADAYVAARARYPDAAVFWAASDSMALGVLDAAAKAGDQPGADFVTGGIDLLPGTQTFVGDGRLAVSIGAHYSEGAWAVLLMYDYLSGCDFVDLPYKNMKSTMLTYSAGDARLIPGENREEFAEWSRGVDFSAFSRCRPRGKKTYAFDARTFFE